MNKGFGRGRDMVGGDSRGFYHGVGSNEHSTSRCGESMHLRRSERPLAGCVPVDVAAEPPTQQAQPVYDYADQPRHIKKNNYGSEAPRIYCNSVL